jgi:hypothetical protein
MSTFKLLLLLASFCLTMWQLPQMIGAVDGAKSGSMSQMLQMIGGTAPNTASAGETDPEHLNQLLKQLGVPAVGTVIPTDTPGTGDPMIITPGGSPLTPEQARELVEQQRRDAIESTGNQPN